MLMSCAMYGEPLPIQSEKGQEHIRRDHGERMAVLDRYPTIRQHVHDDRWAQAFLKQQLAREGDVIELTYPVLYGAVHAEDIGVLPPNYLARAEAGLAFLVRKAPKMNRTDLIGNLQKAISTAAIFEVHIAEALVREFGEDAVEPYPRISQESRRTVEFGVNVKDTCVYFEATALFDEPSESAAKAFCIRERLPFPICYLSGDEGIHRLITKCQQKAMQRDLHGPLILCINQFCNPPDPETGKQAMRDLSAWADTEPDCPMAAVAYYWSEWFQILSIAEAVSRRMGLAPEILGRVEKALKGQH